MVSLSVVPPSSSGGKKFRGARYAPALWDAIYPQPARNYSEIIERMSQSVGKKLSFHDVNYTIRHVRENAEDYGWTIPHVQKGRKGEYRAYFPVVLDENSPALQTDESKIQLKYGAVSSCNTIASMAEHEAVALEAASTAETLTPAQRRKVYAASSMFIAAARMAHEVANQIHLVA